MEDYRTVRAPPRTLAHSALPTALRRCLAGTISPTIDCIHPIIPPALALQIGPARYQVRRCPIYLASVLSVGACLPCGSRTPLPGPTPAFRRPGRESGAARTAMTTGHDLLLTIGRLRSHLVYIFSQEGTRSLVDKRRKSRLLRCVVLSFIVFILSSPSQHSFPFVITFFCIISPHPKRPQRTFQNEICCRPVVHRLSPRRIGFHRGGIRDHQ